MKNAGATSPATVNEYWYTARQRPRAPVGDSSFARAVETGAWTASAAETSTVATSRTGSTHPGCPGTSSANSTHHPAHIPAAAVSTRVRRNGAASRTAGARSSVMNTVLPTSTTGAGYAGPPSPTVTNTGSPSAGIMLLSANTVFSPVSARNGRAPSMPR